MERPSANQRTAEAKTSTHLSSRASAARVENGERKLHTWYLTGKVVSAWFPDITLKGLPYSLGVICTEHYELSGSCPKKRIGDVRRHICHNLAICDSARNALHPKYQILSKSPVMKSSTHPTPGQVCPYLALSGVQAREHYLIATCNR